MAKEYVNTADCEEGKEEESNTEQEQCFGFGQQRSKWSQIRAVILSQPKEILEAEPGSIIYVPVEIQNQTKWPWKRGCFIGLLDRSAKSEMIVGDVPVDFEVRGL
jgi:hypothetical protein